ncbi:hypothetical protein EAH73_04390, partial [Hymenobacter nivis]
MQKLLNTQQSASYLLLRRLFTGSKATLLALVALVLFIGSASQANAQNSGFYKNFEVFNGTYYYTLSNGGGSAPAFPNNNSFPGTYAQGSQLLLDAEANTFENSGKNVQKAQFSYRVYPKDAANKGNFITLPLTLAEAVESPQFPGSFNKKWINSNTKPDLLAFTSGKGTYTLELYFDGNVNDGTKIFDSNNGNNYKADFEVTGNAPAQWTGNAGQDWFNAANWSPQTVPDANTDVTIPAGTSNIPKIFNGKLGPAQVRSLRIGTNGTPGARALILAGTDQSDPVNGQSKGELRVYGNFFALTGGFSQEPNSTFVLAGGDQEFDGATFIDVRIEGGGTKSLTNRMDIKGVLTFVNGVLKTPTLDPSNNSVDLIYDPNNIGTGNQIVGETATSYVQGFLRSLNRTIVQNAANTFNNIGVVLTPNGGSPGVVSVTRLTGFTYKGVGTSQSIQRSFTFSATGISGTPSFSLGFRYLDNELNGITESNLVLFRAQNGFVPFRPLAKTTIDAANNLLVRSNIEGVTNDGVNTLLGVFTLGDATNPLPVTLTSFAAVAQGPDALLSWTTAQELNNAGFEVQVSTDGTAFAKLGFVAAASPNSSEARAYQFRDATAGKQGTRFYRLRQLDTDGKESFFAPQSLAFGGALAASAQA